MTARDEQGIAGVLAEHVQVGGTWWDHERKATFSRCNCGVMGYLAGREPTHEQHVATALLASPEFAQIIADAKAEALRETADEIGATAVDRERVRPLAADATCATDFANDWQWAERIVRARAAALTEDARGEDR